MPIYVTPFYNAEGPEVAVGKYSDDLARANANTIEKTVAAMKAEWDELRPEAMYVAAIRLFDLGLKDEAVYWFYSAQYRARLFQALCDTEEVGPLGRDAVERGNAYDAIFLLVGPHINPYAFDHPKKLAETLARVQSEGQTVPDFKKMYPDVALVDNSRWVTIRQEVDSGLTELRNIVEEHAAAFPDGVPEDASDSKPGEMNARRVWPDPQVAALATAAQNGDVAEIDRLVAAGVDVNTEGLGRMTPLYWALRAENKPGFTRLLDHGASPNVETADGDSVMHLAAESRSDSEWLELALKSGGNPNLPRSKHRRVSNRTPIFDAIGVGGIREAQLLIEAEADVNRRDHENRTPLEYAIRLGNDEIAYQLLKAGADYDVITSDGKDIATRIRELAANPTLAAHSPWLEKAVQFLDQQAAKEAIRVPGETDDNK